MTQTSHPTLNNKRPFSLRDCFGYMFGDFGNDFTFILQSTFFMLFYTNVVGINPAHVGFLLLGARILDAFTDVGMGIIVDRLPVKKPGYKFKRWILYMAVPVTIASALMYMSFVGNWDSYTAKLLWMCVTYFLWGSICYTAINIPYGSMASVISPDPDDRSKLSVFRSTGGQLASLVIQAILPVVVYTKTAESVSVMVGEKMMLAAIVCSILGVVCYALCFINVEERVVSEQKAKDEGGQGVGQMLASLTRNRGLLTLVLAALLLLVSMMFLMGIVGYICLAYFNDGQLQSPASILAIVPAFTLIVLAPILGKKFGKAEVCSIAMLIGGGTLLTAYFLKIDVGNPWLWIALYAVAMFCINVFNYLVWAFITDVIDLQDVQTGSRDDGTVYAVYSWARKLGQALAGWLLGMALSWVGFDAVAAKDGIAQSQEALDGIYALANVLPGIGCVLVAVVLLFLYPLKKNRVTKNVEILEARRRGEKHVDDPVARATNN
ncbi:glycoside-pentoside-hexuronide (GPH):cation symporter [Propionimicrobium lymphophilum]|uniref:Sugar (Glycoside-Pentoside-Hexuronide) transporter n=1 Tax=Propionimicrobium lymphophilum ACS-093-V-SCH5 TaxID=883161 RepID=S2WXM7_9ACTN|nr:glycoside-pentoside-hexuronide (GPH):cation symporter [Propionimicrobium lymphophilum]EPD32529.1 sugar (Glycoside-Pentoside-Hexuronide) transporter [Propionimicrobium lymphophilum ACS-093-V-SCH5]MDK7710508.1 glycoside-pentoside-hexuronide (GPH):cation symporter [Propionimicrobium lymphophilum]MDK7734470.1 glycoside-pentoside-hexuronide (GPH):cation symporter [Propionimicrobium lymphophilum]